MEDKNEKMLYLTSKHKVSFDEKQWYIDAEPQHIATTREQEDSSENKAKEKSLWLASVEIGKLLTHFTNIAVLTAAGTSMDNGVNHGKTRDGLWDYCKDEIEGAKQILKDKGLFSGNISEEYTKKNIEHFLSHLLMVEKIGQKIEDGKGTNIIHALKKKIASACSLELDSSNRHHGDFIAKLTARKPSDPRLQLFTTNYDTLFEQAAHKRGYTIIDGFSFSYPRIFNGLNFDYDIVYRNRTRVKNEESFVPKVFHLYKLHGSVDWEQRGDGVYQTEKVEMPCIVYPASNKYESSYEQPYFEMMAHFQQTLRKDGTLLIVVGFGFADKHIQNVIKEAVLQNQNFHLLIVCYGKEDNKETGITNQLVPDFLNDQGDLMSDNISILFSTFKDFVNAIPLNNSYSDESNNEAI